MKQSGAGQVVVDCSYSNIRLVLKAAQAVREYYIMLRIYYEDHLKVGTPDLPDGEDSRGRRTDDTSVEPPSPTAFVAALM